MKPDSYRATLRGLSEWDRYLLEHSGLPGPRGNLEPAQAVAEEGDRERFERYVGYGPEQAPANSPCEFLAFCGVLGFGRLLCEGAGDALPRLRVWASDPRWRIREAVAMVLQRWGDLDLRSLTETMEDWSRAGPLEQRAAVAALCEPRLLRSPTQIRRVLRVLKRVTASVEKRKDRSSEGFRALRKGLAYGWSVAVASLPAEGKPAMEAWFQSEDRDIRWIMRENLKNSRLARRDADWVARWSRRLAARRGPKGR